MARACLFVLLLAGCGSSGAPGSPDGGADGSSPDTGPSSHPLCPQTDAGVTFSDEIGKSCPMGSNLNLCAHAPSSSCSDTEICLWHGDDVSGVRAYCTIACDPTKPDSCPPRFACKAQGCSSAPPDVCVRVEADPKPEDACEDGDSMLAGRGLSLRAVARAGQQIYVAGHVSQPASGTVVLTRAVDETVWKLIHDGPVDGTLDWKTLAGGAAVLFQSWSGSTQHLLRATGTTVTEESLPACDGDPNTCVRQIDLVFETAEGAVRAIGRSLSGDYSLLARGPQGAWSVTRTLDHKLLWSARLALHGLAAACRGSDEPSDAKSKLCVSRDGDAIEVVDLPPGHALDAFTALGESPDDFYLLTKTALLHRVQQTWLEDGVPVDDGGELAQADDGSLYVGTGGKLYRLDAAGCWLLLPGDPGLDGLVAINGRQFLRIAGYDLCAVVLE
jgi:hypothetical protein